MLVQITTITEYPLIQLLYYKPEGTNGHYYYIKYFSSLTSNQSSSKKILIKISYVLTVVNLP